MRAYTVSDLARLSGVSVRALRHYDEIGLLKPACVGANGYRYYGQEELLRLQQILFHRELGLPLQDIRQVLDASGFDRVAALRAHRARLCEDLERRRRLLRTLDETLAALEGDAEMNENEMYQGFSPEVQAEHEAWLVARYGGDMAERIAASKAAVAGWSRDEATHQGAEAESIEAGLAESLRQGLPASSAPVQALVRRHCIWVGRAWGRRPEREAFKGLAELYREHPDFRARYDGRIEGLTDYLAEAMRVFAEAELA